MREISEAILDDVRSSVPLGEEYIDTERPDPVPDEFVWIRPASTNPGQASARRAERVATLIIDVWTKRVTRLHEILGALVFLDGYREMEYEDAIELSYREESGALDEEADAYHYLLTYSVRYVDRRRM